MKNLYIIFILNIIVFNPIFSQTYFCDNGFKVGKLYLEECSIEYFTDSFGGTYTLPDIFTGITLHPNGKMYANGGTLSAPILVEVDVFTAKIIDTLAESPEPFTSLACDENGILYAGHRSIYSYNIETDTWTSLGILPEFDYVSGGIIFFDGELYVSTLNQFNSNSKLLRVNLENISNSEEVTPSMLNRTFGGLTNYCSEGIKIFLGSEYNSEGDYITYIHKINLADFSTDTICQINLPSNQVIFGLTSTDEFRTTCELQLDLDLDDSSGRLIDHYEVDSLCKITLNITDDDVGIQNLNSTIDSMSIVLVSGEQHPNEEVLTGIFSSMFDIRGHGTNHLSIINQGTATDEDFIDALKAVRFNVLTNDIINGERVLHTTLYSGSSISDAAKTFIYIDVNHQPNAGIDGTAMVCEGRAVDIFDALGGEPEINGHWKPELWSGSNLYVSIHDEPGTYQYITDSGGCTADTAVVQVIEHHDPHIGIDSADLITLSLCLGDTLVWDATLPDAQNYFWNDDYEEPIRWITEEGIYSVEVFDANNCYWFAKTNVLITEEMAMTEETMTLCEGEVFEWNEIIVQNDTIICQTFERGYACDSSHCISFQFEESPISTAYVELCGETEYTWQGLLLENDTLLCLTYTNQEGCDSTECLDLRFLPDYQSLDSHVFICGEEPYEVLGVTFTQDTTFCFSYVTEQGCDSIQCIDAQIVAAPATNDSISICMGETYLFGAQLLDETGDYEATFLDALNCDSLVMLHLEVLPNYENNIDTLLTEGEQIEIGGQIFDETGDYDIPLQTHLGCDSTIFLNLEIITSIKNVEESDNYFIPNIISPYSDSWHHTFIIYTRNGHQEIFPSVVIYDVWGHVIFSAKDVVSGHSQPAWDGTFQGNELPKGVYFYQVILSNGKLLTGSLVLM